MSLPDTLTSQPPPLHVDSDGVARIADTRVTLDTVVAAYEQGASAEEIAQAYDSLSLADVHAVISHYLRHRSEVESYLSERADAAEAVRQEVMARRPQGDIRSRLEARSKERRPG